MDQWRESPGGMYIDVTSVCEDMVVILPVRELRLEGSRDILQG